MKNLNLQFKPTTGLLIPLLLATFALMSLEFEARAQGSGNLENTLRAVLRAVEDIEAAETFSQVQTAIDSNETVWRDRSTVAVLNYILANHSLAGDIRFRRQVERELALEGGSCAASICPDPCAGRDESSIRAGICRRYGQVFPTCR